VAFQEEGNRRALLFRKRNLKGNKKEKKEWEGNAAMRE